MTVLWWGTTKGVRGRCDAKCHGARGLECDCMCKGKYHGVAHKVGGLKAALLNTPKDFYTKALHEAEAGGIKLEFHSLEKLLREEPVQQTLW